jgi:4-carboxymuconolactone decarboxylase
VAPQIATYVLETMYGEIYQNPALDWHTRQIVTVAALPTLGTSLGDAVVAELFIFQ